MLQIFAAKVVLLLIYARKIAPKGDFLFRGRPQRTTV